MPVLARAPAVIAADVVGTADRGDRTPFIGRIESMDAAPTAPLVYFRSRHARLDSDGSTVQVEPSMFR